MIRARAAVALLVLAGCRAGRVEVAPPPATPRPVATPDGGGAPPPLQPAASAIAPAAAGAAHPTTLTPAEIAARATPSVVLIRMPNGLGSGFFVAPDGRIATNLHVIRGAREATVVLADGREFKEPEVLAADEAHDLAVLRVPLSGLPSLPLGDSGAVKPGERVVAIGHPLGLGNTVTDGLVSAVRAIDDDLTVLQVSAPISPGSSGGPLLDEHGRVIGISTLMSARGQNLNFGVPVAYLKPMLLASATGVPFGEWSRRRAAAAPRRAVPRHPLSLVEGCAPSDLALIVRTIAQAVQLGAPLYNQGNPEACYRVYEGAALALGQKLDACPGVKQALEVGLRRAEARSSFETKAWALRDAFDGVMDVIERRISGGDGAPEAAPERPRPGVRRREIPVHPITLVRACRPADLSAARARIKTAIDLGAPLYNQGNREACFRIYDGAALELDARLKRCPGAREALAEGRRRAADSKGWDDKAFALRDAFDGLVDVITRRLEP